MPIYEYACPRCQKTFEEWLKSDDNSATHPCPDCDESAPRVISQTSFILKGGGWYVTEYGAHHTETDGADTPENAHGDTQGEKSETAPAPTGEALPASTPAPVEPKDAPKAAPAAASQADATAGQHSKPTASASPTASANSSTTTSTTGA